MIFRDRQRGCGQLFHRILFLLTFWHLTFSALLVFFGSSGLRSSGPRALWRPSWSSGPSGPPGSLALLGLWPSGPLASGTLVLWLLLRFGPLCLASGLCASLLAFGPCFGPWCLASGLCASLRAFVPRFRPLCLASGLCASLRALVTLASSGMPSFWLSGMPCFWLSSLLWQHWADYADLLFLNRHHLLLLGTLMRHLLCVYDYPVFGWCPYRMLSSGSLFGMNLQLCLYLVYLTFSILYERRGDRGSYWIHARLFT